MRYGSLFSGIEAASLAFRPLGWTCAWVAEIDPFCSALLRHRYPDVPNLGDVTKVDWDAIEPVDLIVGGSPCQSFSIAGKRLGLDDPRGNLALVYLDVVRRVRPRWMVFENVPGLLSSDEGRDFGAFLGLLGELGYGFAYRVLDAQYGGVPQRRRRLWVVGHSGGQWQRAAAVLFDAQSLHGDPAPGRQTGERAAGTIAASADRNRGLGNENEADNLIADTVRSHPRPGSNSVGNIAFGAYRTRRNFSTETFITHTLDEHGRAASDDGTGRGAVLVSFTGDASDCISAEDLAQPITGRNGDPGMIAFTSKDHGALNGRRSINDPTIESAPVEALRALRQSLGEETFVQWALGGLGQFWPQEVLQPDLHGGGVRCAALPKRGLLNVALSRSQAGAVWTLQDLWEAGCDGCPPQGWGLDEQFARELGAYLSRLPYSPSPAERFLQALRQAAEGPGLLRQALSAVQEARRSACGQSQSIHASGVRRLVPEECEALMNMPRGYTAVPYRGKPAADGPRYKAIGNSMVVSEVRWIGERIGLVDGI